MKIVKNIGWAYYREYYHQIQEEETGGKKKILPGPFGDNTFFTGLKSGDYAPALQQLHERMELGANAWLEATLTGRGLITGVGINHNLGIKEEWSFGFMFDFTTGIPFLPGSSLKGALRAHASRKSILPLLKKHLGSGDSVIDQNLFIDRVFSGLISEGSKNKKSIPSFQQVHFLGGAPVGRFVLAKDTITPHKDPLQKPLPLPFLKMDRGTRLRFYFYLSEDIQVLYPKILDLFAEFISRYGLGAKTNYDFGRFDPNSYTFKYPQDTPEPQK